MKISWRWTCSQIFRKFRRLESAKYSICSSLDFENRLWEIIFTQERAQRQTFTYLKSTIETLKKKCENYSKLTIKTPERLSTLLIVNFGHNSLLFLVSCCWLWTSKCLLGPTLSIYKRWNNTVAITDLCTKILVK